MNERKQKIEALFEECLALSTPEQRATHLSRACGNDSGLRQEVEELLCAADQAGGFLALKRGGMAAGLEHPLPASQNELAVIDQPGDHIGRYKLLEKLGEGGFGVVYMAEQREPVKRRVALKIIKLGMDTREVVARFEAERQALALMDHPNIAKILDGGVTGSPVAAGVSPGGKGEAGSSTPEGSQPSPGDKMPSSTAGETPAATLSAGRPYFVMELVRGIRITDYCDQNQLRLEERLKLFMQVCHAVQHAHQKGIIHRDLKPSNILVTLHDGIPVPKVIDFGIAKAVQQELTEKTLFTQFHQFIGTPSYMSPEQAELSGLDIDTRSDIYSLGVLLYELLAGKPPFDGQALLQAGLDEMRRTLREVEPPRPSTRLKQTRSSHPDAATNPPIPIRGSEIDSDLDWIVMKCLEKDRTRRYETAYGLAADLQRHLSNEPVVARPPTAAYRLQKMVRRNRKVFVSGAVVALALVAGLALCLWQYLEKRQAFDRAQTETVKARQVARLLKDTIKGMKPSIAMGRDTSILRDIADRALEQVSQRQDFPAEVGLELRATVGEVYHVLGEYGKAESLHRETLPQMQRLLGRDAPATTDLLRDYACVLNHRGKSMEAEKLAREALAIERRRHGETHLSVAQSLANLAAALDGLKRHSEAESSFQQSLAVLRPLFGPERHEIGATLIGLAACLDHQGKHEAAVAAYRESIAVMKRVHGPADPNVAYALRELAIAQGNHGQHREAEDLYRELLPLQRRFFGDNSRLAETLNALAASLVNRGKPAEAEPFAREAIAVYRKVRGEEHKDVAKAMHDLGMSLAGQGRRTDAAALLREVLAMQRKVLRPGSSHLGLTLRNLGEILTKLQRRAEAEQVWREGADWERAKAANEKILEVWIRLRLAELLERDQRPEEAELLYREVLQAVASQSAPDRQAIERAEAGLKRIIPQTHTVSATVP